MRWVDQQPHKACMRRRPRRSRPMRRRPAGTPLRALLYFCPLSPRIRTSEFSIFLSPPACLGSFVPLQSWADLQALRFQGAGRGARCPGLPTTTAIGVWVASRRASRRPAGSMPPSASTDFLEALTPDMLANLLGSGRINVTAEVCSSRGLPARAAAAPPAPPAPAAVAAA